jgi:hypothetical protein
VKVIREKAYVMDVRKDVKKRVLGYEGMVEGMVASSKIMEMIHSSKSISTTPTPLFL